MADLRSASSARHGPMFGALARELERTLPGHYKVWLYTGSLVTGLAYGTVALSEVLTAKPALEETLVVVASFVAMLLVKRDRFGLAAFVLLSAIWLDLHLAFLRSDAGLRSSSIAVLPAFIMGVALVAGGPAALVVAAITSLTVPLAIEVARLRGLGPGLTQHSVSVLITIIAAINATAAVLWMFLRTLTLALDSARRNAERAEQLLESSPDAMIALTPDARVAAFNGAALELLGAAAQHGIGRPLGELRSSLCTTSGAPLSHAASCTEPIELHDADSQRVLEALCRPLPDSGKILVLRDVTSRKRAEREALRLERELYHAQRLEAVGRLSASVAHDFNNVLTIIGGYGELLERSPDAQVSKMASELVATQRRAAVLTRRLLSFSRKDFSQPRLMDLAAVVRDSSALLTHITGDSITLQVEAETPCPVIADPQHIEQLVLNLGTNAADAMPRGGTLTVSCRHDPEGRVELTVRDTGEGMSESVKLRIFEPFFTTKEQGKGTGLGLATVRRIVDEMGADISVESALGHGTSFVIRWPELHTETLPPAESGSSEIAGASGARILLVEDDPRGGALLRSLLADAGYGVTLVDSAERALDRLAQRPPPDLLITDVMLPGKSGVELATLVRERSAQLPVLFISGFAEEALDGDALRALGQLVPKPFRIDQLLLTVEAAITSSRGSVTRAAE